MSIELAPQTAREVVFLLGEAESKAAPALVAQFRQHRKRQRRFRKRCWTTGTNSSARCKCEHRIGMDTMLNRWLLYQTLSCRVWARTAFYQSGGAYGFRDQLQDVMALVYSKPDIARRQIVLRARTSSRKETFSTGGIRRVAAACAHASPTTWCGCRSSPRSISTYGRCVCAGRTVPSSNNPCCDRIRHEATCSQRCRKSRRQFMNTARALRSSSLAVGKHGLPLMGGGDWNDGMNRVGHGRQRRKRLAWLVFSTRRSPLSHLTLKRASSERVNRYRKHLDNLRKALEEKGWDGDWYRRAYFDDGTPLGSARNEECRIDSIAQSWSVISGAADPYRMGRAMAAVEEYLIRRGDGLVILFTPPFDKGSLDPGYIKGYVPGVRENGGQYTHAAIWTLIAYSLLGDGERAGELFALSQSDQSFVDARGAAQVQSRTLRGGRGCLCGSTAHRPRRLDVVHRLGGLDVSRRS